MQIDKIEKHRKKNVFHLYSDDTLLMSISEDTIVHFHLFKGKEVSQSNLDEIYEHDQTIQCAHQAYRFLSRRAHLSGELQRKLRGKSYSGEIIEKAVQMLKDKGYLNDEDFVVMFINEEMNLKCSGPLLIRKKLMEKGAARNLIDESLEQLYNETIQVKNAGALLNKKLKKTENVDKSEKQKLQRYLMAKGYTWEIIKLCFDHINIE